MSAILNFSLLNAALHEAVLSATQENLPNAIGIISSLDLSEEQKELIFSILKDVKENPSNALNLEARISVIAHQHDDIQPLHEPEQNALTFTQAERQLVPQNEFSLLDLKEDVRNLVLQFLNPEEFFDCRLICKHFNEITRGNLLCRIMYERHLSRDYPTRNPNLGFYDAFKNGCISRLNVLKGVCSQQLLVEGADGSSSVGKHTGPVNYLTVFGKNLYSHSANEINIWDLNTGDLLLTLPKGVDVNCFAVSNGMLCAGSPGEIKIQNALTGELLRAIKGDQLTGYFFVFGKTLCLDSDEGSKIEIWDLDKLDYLYTLQRDLLYSTLAVSDKELYIASPEGGIIEIFELATGTCSQTLERNSSQVRFLAVLDKKLYLGPLWGRTEIWDLVTGTLTEPLLQTQQGTKFNNGFVFFDRKLCLPIPCGGVEIWDLDTNTELDTLKGGYPSPFVFNEILSLAASDGKLCVGFDDGKIEIWDFQATHAQVFEEIADLLSSNNEKALTIAMVRFFKMPEATRNKIYTIYNELYPILDYDIKSKGEAFHARSLCGSISEPEQRVEAIRRYLQSQEESNQTPSKEQGP